jgi:hypothetical protein
MQIPAQKGTQSCVRNGRSWFCGRSRRATHVQSMSVPQGTPPPWSAARAGAHARGDDAPPSSRRAEPPAGFGTPAGYSGYRSKEGYAGFHARRDTSNIRSSADQLRSSEALSSIWRPSLEDRAAHDACSSSSKPSPATVPRAPQERLNISPQKINEQFYTQSRPAHYEFMDTIEGYAGHRPRTPAVNNLGSGAGSWCHSEPRAASPGSPNRSPATHRVKMLSHNRGVYVP